MREMSALDLKFVVPELKKLEGAFIQKIYQDGKAIRLEVYISNKGSFEIYFDPGKIFITQYKRKAPESPEAFCMKLRKTLKGQKIKEISQVGFERIIEIHTDNNILILEMFSKGNAILCDGLYNIIVPLEVQLWRDRQVVPKKKYSFPPMVRNPFEIDMNELKVLLKNPKQLVRFLATDMSFSGLYAEEICLRTQIDKETVCETLGANDVMVIYEAMHSLKKTFNPKVIWDDDNKIDAVPFEMQVYGDKKQEAAETFVSALDELYMQREAAEFKEEVEKVKSDQVSKVEKLINKQKNKVDELRKISIESREKAELIYNNYDFIQKVVDDLQNALESGKTWEEIKEKAKQIDKIVEIREEDGVIVLDL